MTPQELKNSILQLAIQGKLVEQREEEGTAEDLFDSLIEKKKELLALGKIIKKRPTKPFYSKDILEKISIPINWRWAKLSDVSLIQEGAGIRKWQYRDSGIQILCVTNILNGSIDLEKKKLYISEEEYKEKYQHLTLDYGDIVTACSGGSWGKVAIFNDQKTIMLNTSTLRMRFFGDLCSNKFLYYVCQSNFFKKQLQGQLSGMQPNFGYAHYSRIMIPLPPLAEQQRIVAKIEELLPHIDRYEQAWSKLEQFNARFPEDMKKALLQYAIQGKLVEQRPEEGNAEDLYAQIQTEKQRLIAEKKIKKQKPLPAITDEEKPFDIPKSWKWVRLREICSKIVDGDHNPPAGVAYQTNFLMLSAQNINQDRLVNLDNVRYLSEDIFNAVNQRTNVVEGDILFTIVGTLGRSCVYRGGYNVTFQRSVSVITTLIYNYFLKYSLDAPFIQQFMVKNASGTAQKGFYLKQLEKLLIPLPPLAEQKRIVEKLEQLLPLCDQLLN